MKRRVTIVMTVCMIIGLIVSVFIPQVMDIPYQQGKSFAKDICLLTEEQLKNGSFDFSNISIGGNLWKK